ncbi:hypothetical protein KUV46_15755 [Thalassovita mediterranea]|nr:hypothetical protein KUV46_15755 [Thalassovita mediterranea]
MTILSPKLSGLGKHPLASRGIWGGIVALVSLIAGGFGYVITPEEQEALVVGLSGLGALIGVVIGIYGRWKATKVIGG